MKRNQRRERTKQQTLTKRTANQKQDTCISYNRVTINKTTAVRCYQLKVQHAIRYTQITITKLKKWTSKELKVSSNEILQKRH